MCFVVFTVKLKNLLSLFYMKKLITYFRIVIIVFYQKNILVCLVGLYYFIRSVNILICDN